MIVGVGVDIESVNRFRIMDKGILRRVLKRIFTEKEVKYCNNLRDPFPCYTGRFCAKEAFLKATGLKDFYRFKWHEMEILGKPPEFKTYGGIESFIRNEKIRKIWVSISHTIGYAAAIVVLER